MSLFQPQDIVGALSTAAPDPAASSGLIMATVVSVEWSNNNGQNPSTLTCTIGGGTTTLTGIPFLNSFTPQASCNVWLASLGSSYIAVGTTNPFGVGVWTPTLGGAGQSMGNAGITALYSRVGGVVTFQATITLGTTTSFGGAGVQVIMSLPQMSSGAPAEQWMDMMAFNGAVNMAGKARIVGPNQTGMYLYIARSASTNNEMVGMHTANDGFTWGTGYFFTVYGSYFV